MDLTLASTFDYRHAPCRETYLGRCSNASRNSSLKGSKLYPVMQLCDITVKSFSPILRPAEELQLHLVLHLKTSPFSPALLKYSYPLLPTRMVLSFLR